MYRSGKGSQRIAKTVIAVPTSAERKAFTSGCNRHRASLGDALDIVQTGMGPDGLEDKLSDYLDNAVALVSLGTAGALSPQLRPGDLLLPRTICSAAGQFETEPPWQEQLAFAMNPIPRRIHTAPMWYSETIVSSTAAKQELCQATGTVAVDMESGALARLAGQRGIPFLVLRVVADSAVHAVPTWTSQAVDPAGDLHIGRLLRGLGSNPAELLGLIRMTIDFNHAARTLRTAGRFGAGVLARRPDPGWVAPDTGRSVR